MRRIILLVSILMLTGILSFSVEANELTENNEMVVTQEGENEVIIITGEENIRKYQQSLGEEYNPNILMIKRIIKKQDLTENQYETVEPIWLDSEYYATNVECSSGTDISLPLRKYIRSAGKILINESVELSSIFSADSGITTELVEKLLAMDLTITENFSIYCNQKVDTDVVIYAYPIYEDIKGDVYEDDVAVDDYKGHFWARVPIGTDVRVQKK